MDVIDQMLEYGGQAGMVPAYLARPDTGERRPGIVLIHDIFGLSDHTKDVARRFVGEGYVALAPHLFARPALAEAFAPGRVREATRSRRPTRVGSAGLYMADAPVVRRGPGRGGARMSPKEDTT